MRVRTKRILIGIYLAAVILLLLLLLAALQEMWYEDSGYESVDVNERVDGFSMDFATLNGYLCARFPEDCAGKQFVRATANIHIQNNTALHGEIVLSYYRYIDETRKGGNVEGVSFLIDPVSQTLVKIIRHAGSGTSIISGDGALYGSVLHFPLAEYIRHATALTGAAATEELRLYVFCLRDSFSVSLFSVDDARMYALYKEYLTGWRAGDSFASREFELVS